MDRKCNRKCNKLCPSKFVPFATTYALSYMCGIPQATIKSILNGESKNPGIVTLKKICDGLEITMMEFFDTPEYKKLEQELK